MMSYILSWIALLSEWNYRSSTEPCYLAQTTQIEIYNKSREGFVLRKGKKTPPSVMNSNLSFPVMLL